MQIKIANSYGENSTANCQNSLIEFVISDILKLVQYICKDYSFESVLVCERYLLAHRRLFPEDKSHFYA
jgi:hypothetical protein